MLLQRCFQVQMVMNLETRNIQFIFTLEIKMNTYRVLLSKGIGLEAHVTLQKSNLM